MCQHLTSLKAEIGGRLKHWNFYEMSWTI